MHRIIRANAKNLPSSETMHSNTVCTTFLHTLKSSCDPSAHKTLMLLRECGRVIVKSVCSVLFRLAPTIQSIWTSYGIAQFKLDRTRIQQGHDTTRFSFHTHPSLRVHARLVTSNLSYKALMYELDVCTMHVCMSGMTTPNMNYAYMQILRQGQWNKLYKHVYVLRHNPPCDTRHKSC